MKKLILISCMILFTGITYIQSVSRSLSIPISSISLNDIFLSAQANDGELPPGYILLEEPALISEGYWEGEYWIEPVYDCVDANDKCLNI
jgi:hypothetical protein